MRSTTIRKGSVSRTIMCYSRFALFPLLAFFPVTGFPQWIPNANFSIRQFADDSGLPQNSIKAIGPDRDGFVWLATEFGLVRFDGNGFQQYRKDTGSLLNSRIFYFRPTGRPYEYMALSGNYQLSRVDASSSPLPDSLLTTSIYLRGYEGAGDFFFTNGLPNHTHTECPAHYYCLPLDTLRYFQVSSDSVYYKDANRNIYAIKYPVKNTLRYFILQSQLYYLDPGALPVWVHQNGVRTVQFTGDILRHPAFPANSSSLIVYWNMLVNQVFIYLQDNLYLLRQDGAGNLHTSLVLSGFDCDANKILCIYHDTVNGKTLLGSEITGLFVAKRHDFTTLGVRNGLNTDNVFYAHAPYRDSLLLTPQGYILGSSGYQKPLPALQALHLKDRYSILNAADNTIWVKYDTTLLQLDAEGDAILRRFTFPKLVTQLFEDSSRRLWIGTKGGAIYSISPGMKQPSILVPGNWDVSYIQQQNATTYWFGTLHGCYRTHLSTHQVDTIHGMEGKYIRNLYVRSGEEVWMTTYEEGFFLYDGHQVTRFPLDKNKFLLTAHCLLEDENGFFWITTNKGLFQVAREDLLRYARGQQRNIFYYYYEKSSGFRTNEFNGGCQPCGIRLSQGRFSFPSLNGLVTFQPALLQPVLPSGPLFVHRVEVDGAGIAHQDTLSIPRDAQQVRLYVSTPYSGHPNNLNIEYTVVQEAGDTVWLPLGDEHIITLGSIPSGTHRLIIRNLAGFGANNYKYRFVTLVVPPYFYQSVWFIAVTAMALLALAWLLSAIRTRYIRHKNHELEEHIQSRTQQLENTMLALQESEYHLRRQANLQKRLITAMAHDIKTPLKFMADSANRMARRLGLQGLAPEQEEAQVLYESGTQVYHYTENLLQYIKTQTGQQQIILKPVNLYQLVEEKLDIFQQISLNQDSEIINQVPPGLTTETNVRLLGVILHNILDNAVKVTLSGQITVSAYVEAQTCIIAVEDSGAGMRPALVEWCNAPVQQDALLQESDRVAGHHGMGLLIVKELSALIHARLQVTTGAVRGTRVHILISLPEYQQY